MCDPGDIIRCEGPGAGGYGNPFERPVERVLDDVRCGFVSSDRARSDYGVSIDVSGRVDVEQTALLRLRMARQKKPVHFTHGSGRIAFEAVWTRERYATLTRILAEMPVAWRFFVKHRLFAALAGQVAGADGGAASVIEHYRALAEEFSELPPADHLIDPVPAERARALAA
jgi:N-methylhydantoinase B